jgi:ribose transport system permease protein
MTSTVRESLLEGTQSPWRRMVRRQGWTVGVWVLLFLLIAYYSTLIPKFGSFQVAWVINNGQPIVFLAVAQAVIVIAGGIDLGVGGMLVLTSVTSARLMEGQSLSMTLLIAVGVLAAAAIMNAGVGWIINVSNVPDIVITLGSLYVFQGMALAVLPNPGGGANGGFRWLFTGSDTGVGSNWWPGAVMITITVVATALWLARTRSGLSLYAIGSNKAAAYLSGLNAARVKILSYAVGGAFAALAGLATTAIAGRGNATVFGGTRTLDSVAAIVLGGVALTGGIGSVIAVIPAGLILFFLNPILTAMGVDPHGAQIIQGVLIVLVLMVTGVIEWRRKRRG